MLTPGLPRSIRLALSQSGDRMTRAAVLIGVNRTGGLPMLNDAVAGARSMEQWALSQGFARKRVLLFTDETGPVDIGDIKKGIRSLVESGSIAQLIVYFAGHGVNIRYGEYWLLTDAPVDPSAAVNVEGSIVLARRSGIPHVVFISDACRTAAEGIQAQGITGSEIFPNDPVPGPEQAVDVFFATTLGRPALEVKDPVAASSAFKAVYTQALLDAVAGRIPAALKVAEQAGRKLHLVQPRPLKSCLLGELPRRLAALGVSATVSQVPDARITSDDGAWLARLESLPPPAPPVPRGQSGPPGPPAMPGAAPAGISPAVPAGFESPQARADAQLEALLRAGVRAVPSAATLSAGVPPHLRIPCGLRVVGAGIGDCLSVAARVALVPGDLTLARVELSGPAANVLLMPADGSGVLIPALRGFVATLAFEDGELVDVSYEPSGDTPRSAAFNRRAGQLHALRKVIAGAARSGVFRLEEDRAAMLTRQMQYDGLIDPALALYAAYALHGLRMTAGIRRLAQTLREELEMSFFDIELLSGGPRDAHHPPFPMLAQGWALLPAFGAVLPEGLESIQRELLPSLWTHFNPAGASRLRELMLARRLR